MPPRQATQADNLGEMLDALSNPHRRHILTRLTVDNPRKDDELDFGELVDDSELEDVTVTLLHNHLPKLDELGFISCDQEQRVVTRGPRFHEIAPLIDLMVAHQDELPANWL